MSEAQAPLAEVRALNTWLTLYEPVIVASTLLFAALYWVYAAPGVAVLGGATGLGVWPLNRYARHQFRRGRVEPTVIAISVGLWLLALAVASTGAPAFPVAALISVGAVILAVPYAGRRALGRAVVCSTAVCAIAAGASLREPIASFDPIPGGLVAALVAFFSLLVLALYCVVAWQSNARLGQTLQEMREANRALADSERELERKVAERTDELARQNRALEVSQRELAIARDEAVAANRHKSTFLANMSHELRTPLNAVIGFSEVLLEKVFGELNDKQDEYLHDIHSSGKHLLSLINDVLDLSKIEAGRLELAPSTFSLPVTVDNAMVLMRDRARRAGVGLSHEVAPELDEMTADERKLKQMLLNLLTNAVKFTKEGGSVTLRVRRVDDDVEIQVEDTGIGIAEKDQQLIFEEFRQVQDDYSRSQEGTGLGLTLTKRLVELHGGSIRLESELGRGSTFTLRLPLHVGAPDGASA